MAFYENMKDHSCFKSDNRVIKMSRVLSDSVKRLGLGARVLDKEEIG